jgi:hypothetical protein
MPIATLTITRTSSGANFDGTLSAAQSDLPGGNANLPNLSKDNRYFGFIPNSANSGSFANMPAVPYRWMISENNAPATYTLVLS